uniref:Uncharacterized protein n=1 Tax=Pipistrellus kuhlii TaxID=59472 RepID=A0A7J7QS50_PIPKU|nr:hypothetical protein mPipKuh1_008751 [Pipistrellus kuhlii]
MARVAASAVSRSCPGVIGPLPSWENGKRWPGICLLPLFLLLLSQTSGLHHLGSPSPGQCTHGSGSQAPAAPGDPGTRFGCPPSELSRPAQHTAACSAGLLQSQAAFSTRSWECHQTVPVGRGGDLPVAADAFLSFSPPHPL